MSDPHALECDGFFFACFARFAVQHSVRPNLRYLTAKCAKSAKGALFCKTQDDAADTALEYLGVEIDQEPKVKIHQLQIREHLSDVNRLQSVHRFEFQQDQLCLLYTSPSPRD